MQREQLMPLKVTIKLISVQLKLKLPSKTELGNKYILSRVGAAGQLMPLIGTIKLFSVQF